MQVLIDKLDRDSKLLLAAIVAVSVCAVISACCQSTDSPRNTWVECRDRTDSLVFQTPRSNITEMRIRDGFLKVDYWNSDTKWQRTFYRMSESDSCRRKRSS